MLPTNVSRVLSCPCQHRQDMHGSKDFEGRYLTVLVVRDSDQQVLPSKTKMTHSNSNMKFAQDMATSHCIAEHIETSYNSEVAECPCVAPSSLEWASMDDVPSLDNPPVLVFKLSPCSCASCSKTSRTNQKSDGRPAMKAPSRYVRKCGGGLRP
jgi:hypothetical protein